MKLDKLIFLLVLFCCINLYAQPYKYINNIYTGRQDAVQQSSGGSGDMQSSVYDPIAGARQVAFQDELANISDGSTTGQFAYWDNISGSWEPIPVPDIFYNAGEIGIGVSLTERILHLRDANDEFGQMLLESNPDGTGTDTGYAGALMRNNTSGSIERASFGLYSDEHAFWPNQSGFATTVDFFIADIAGTYRMIVDENGDVGIGTTTLSGAALSILETTKPQLELAYDQTTNWVRLEVNSSGWLRINSGGTTNWTFVNGSLQGSAARGPQIDNEAPSDINPVYTFRGDGNTGIGGTTDILTVIAGGEPIGKFEPSQLTLFNGAAGIDYKIIWNGETNNGEMIYNEDEDQFEYTAETQKIQGLTTDKRIITLADDAFYDLPTGAVGFGSGIIGDSLTPFNTPEWFNFNFASDGTVFIVAASSNIRNTNLDGFFCIFDNGAYVRIQNRSGAQHIFKFTIEY